MMIKVREVRERLLNIYKDTNFDETNDPVEIINGSFLADEPSIFGQLSGIDEDYIRRETDWYMTLSKNLHDFTPPIPDSWLKLASKDGRINSNYGWCLFSKDNKNQFSNALAALINNESSKRGSMIYNRPSMHLDFKKFEKNDFINIYSTQVLIKGNKLHYIVYMRCLEAVMKYKSDYHWHKLIHGIALDYLIKTYPKLKKGDMFFNAASISVYPNHYYLLK